MSPSAKEQSSAERATGGVALGDQLLTTKLYGPSTRAGLTVRPRLTGRLDEGTKAKLTLVVAPAGFGKSTLLGEWVLQSDVPVGWLSLDEGDDDPARFLRYVIAAIRTVKPEIGEDALSVLRSPQPPPNRVVSTMLVNGLAAVPHDLALILDDYHAIESEAVHATLAFLLEHLPPQMHLIIASRTDPPLPLTRLLASGQLTNLTPSDLRFTSEEASAFLNEAIGLELPAEEVTTLEEKTEGWIAGLQLAALSLRGREDASGFISAFTGTNRYVFDYLVEEVLDKQNEGTRKFLHRTSILDRMSGPLCDAVTDGGDGQARLEELERANLLITALDDERRWYRYHHLFSDFLRERLRRDSVALAAELHRRASDWHETNGTASEAIGHAVAAGDLERAAGMIERLADAMMGRGEVPSLERLFEALPETVIRSRPRLYLWYIVINIMVNNRWEDAEKALKDVEHRLGLGGEGVGEPSRSGPAGAIEEEERARVAGYIATTRANIAYEGRADLRRAIALNRRAVELLANDETGLARGIAASNLAECLLDVGDLSAARAAIYEAIEVARTLDDSADVTWSLCHLGRLHTIQGRLSEAMKTYEEVLRLAAEHDEAGLWLPSGVAHVRMGELLYERNDLEAAARHLLRGIERTLEWLGLGETTSKLMDVAGTHERSDRFEEADDDAAHAVVPGYIALARVREARGDAEGAFEALQKVEQVARYSRVSPLWRERTKSWLAAWHARLWLAEGGVSAAQHWARERGLSPADEIEYSPEVELERTTLARLLLAQGKHEDASSLLERLHEAAETGGRERTVIEILVLKALLLRTQNDGPAALAVLKRALTLAEPEGYVRTFADEGAPLADLLRRALKEQRRSPADTEGDVTPEYIGKLLAALDAPVTAPTKVHVRGPAKLVLDPITERELEVFKLLDSDLSNREIASKLFVSLATIKSHTKNLYRKLGVRARHQAVARGKELGLL